MVKNGTVQRADGTRKLQWVCRSGKRTENRKYCYSTVDPDRPYRDSLGRPKKKEDMRKPFRNPIRGRRVIITAAQNATDIHEGFLATLETLSKDIEGELRVIPFRYHNPTSHWGERAKDDDWWADVLTPYLFETRRKLNENLVIMGDIKTQPTAVDPLTGMDSLSRGESAVFGHTKQRMKTVATPQNRLPKILVTTGAITLPNYIPATAGKKGEFHHVQGAIVVDIVSPKKFHLNFINAQKDGSFIFGQKLYKPDRTIEDAPPYEALVMGDAHHRFADPEVVEATFGNGGLVDTLGAKVLVWHDLLDCYFGTPHHEKNPFIKIAKLRKNWHIGEDEVRECVEWMQSLTYGHRNIVVPSNHDNMLERWVIREDWKLDPTNAEFYLQTALHMAEHARMSEIGAEYPDPFAYWIDQFKNSDSDITALKRNQPFAIKDIELSYHGHEGPSGARGTVNNLSKIGVKLITGHGHTPAIQLGHWRTGTMTRLQAEYVTGPNNWLNAHVSIDALGKRHMHICIDGKFFAE
jgi:metallophosphoesterase superfamily enzyme